VVGDLAGDVADTAPGCRDDHRLAGLGLCDPGHPEICGEAVETQRSQIVHQWMALHGGHELGGGHDGVLLPPRVAHHDGAHGGPSRAAGDDLAEDRAQDAVADLCLGERGRASRYRPRGGSDLDEDDPQHDVIRGDVGDFDSNCLEVIALDSSMRAPGQDHPPAKAEQP